MTLVKAYVDGAAAPEDIGDANSDSVKKLLAYGSLCCDGSINVDGENIQHIGDPTETAILVAAWRNGMTKDGLNAESPRLAEIPFDSDRKLMTSVNTVGGKTVVIVKGAFDVMAKLCVAGDLDAAQKVNEEMSSQALRGAGRGL